MIGTLFLGLVFFSCEDFEDETYELSTIDAAAIDAFSDTLEVSLTMRSATLLEDTSGNGLGVILAGGGIDTILTAISSLEISDIYAAFQDVGDEAFGVNDSVYSTTIRADSLSYQLLEIASAGTYVLYLKHYAAPSIYTSAGTMVEIEKDDMSPELIAGLYNLPGPVPAIKGRYEYDLDAGTYLFEIARLEATTLDNFDLVFLSE